MLTGLDAATLRARAFAHAVRPTGLQAIVLDAGAPELPAATERLGERPGLPLAAAAVAPALAAPAAALGLEDRGTVARSGSSRASGCRSG